MPATADNLPVQSAVQSEHIDAEPHAGSRGLRGVPEGPLNAAILWHMLLRFVRVETVDMGYPLTGRGSRSKFITRPSQSSTRGLSELPHTIDHLPIMSKTGTDSNIEAYRPCDARVLSCSTLDSSVPSCEKGVNLVSGHFH